MFSNLTAKLAMRKMGLNSSALNASLADIGLGDTAKAKTATTFSAADNIPKIWPPAWMSVKALPLSVQPWLAPPPAPPVAATCPQPGDMAPQDPDRQLTVGRGKPVVVVFLRCVGCAFAQKSFLALRALANHHPGLTCFAVSHASAAATNKWIVLLGGAWNVQVLVDEDRALYAAWGLGVGSMWYVLNPSTQIQSWRETGWLGQSVAAYMDQRRQPAGSSAGASSTGGSPSAKDDAGPTTIMGNKWQESGAFAVDSYGTVVWGRKAIRADDVLDLEEAVTALRL